MSNNIKNIEQVIVSAPNSSIRPGDIPRDPYKVTTTSLTPRTITYTRRITLPKQEYEKYKGPEYKDVKVDPVKTQFGLREVFTSTPESRRKYVRTRKDYNIQATEYNKQALESIEAQKKEIAKYNKAVDEWNKKGRFQTQTFTKQYFPETTKFEYPEIIYQVRDTTPARPTSEEIRAKLFKPEFLQDQSNKETNLIKPSKTGNPKLTGAWIEESKYAIDTAGERQGITAKGLTAIEKERRKENYLKFLKSKAITEKYYPKNGSVRTLHSKFYNPKTYQNKRKNKVLTRLLRT